MPVYPMAIRVGRGRPPLAGFDGYAGVLSPFM
jgi:hypothetical protein